MAISISNITRNSFTVNWTTHGAGVDNYNIEIWRGSTVEHSVRGLSSGTRSRSFSGLQSGTTYEVKLFSRSAQGTTLQIEYAYPTTQSNPPPPTPTNFRVYDRSATELAFAWNTVSGANRYVLEIYRSSNDALVWDARNITGGSIWAGPLISGVSYYAKLYANGEGGNSVPTFLYSIIAGLERPYNWDWYIDKRKGRTYNIFNNSWTNLVSYDEVVAFRTRINAFRTYKGMNTYSFSAISRGSVFTATMYNQMETAIRAMNPPISTHGQQSSGSSQTVDALLNRLMDSLNSIP